MELKKTFEITLDIEKELYSPSNLLFSVSRNDFETIELQFTINQDGAPLDLTGTTVELAIKKPSGLIVYLPCEIVGATEGKANILLSVQAYAEYGIFTAEAYIRTATQLAVTTPFWYQAKSALMTTEDFESVNDWSALQQALFAYDLRPVLTEGFPTIIPQYIGQMAFDTLNDITYIATDLTSASWRTFSTGEGGGGGNDTALGEGAPTITPIRIGQLFIDTLNLQAYIATGATAGDWERIDNEAGTGETTSITWAEILEKPLSFPPDVHTHLWADITDKPTTFTPEAHAHSYAEITDKPTTFTPETHVHTYAEITDKPTTFTPEEHTHEILDVNGLSLALDDKADVGDSYLKTDTYNKTEVYNKDEINQMTFDGGGTVVEDNLTSISTTNALSANQGRILDENKADENHVHTYAEITDKPLTFAPDAHSHSYADITDKPTAFTPEAHTHTKADITDFAHTHLWADITDKPTTFTPEEHTHDEYSTKPSTGTTNPTGAPLFVGQIYINTTTKEAFIANSMLGDWQTISEDELGTGETSVDWVNVLNKPATFTPEAHTHLWADITDKPATFTPSTHTHTKADITDFAHTHLWADITDKPTTFTPDAHSHTITDITNLSTTLEGKDEKPITGVGAPSIVPSYVGQIFIDTTNGEAYIANGLTVGDWQTISNDEEIKAHTHLWADITDKPTTFTPDAHSHSYAEITDKPATFAPEAHTHTKADITDFTHTHLWADITDKPATFAPDAHSHDYAEITGKPTAFTPEAHTHEIADINELSTTLGAKFDKPEATVGKPTKTPKYLGEISIEAGTADEGKTYIANGTTSATWERLADTKYVDVSVNNVTNGVLNGLSIWAGTQADYDLLTPSPTTLYFITG